MIKDNILNIKKYMGLDKNVVIGLEYLKETDFSSMKDGKFSISGNDIFVNLQTYTTKSDADFEAHKNYIDIQYIISGSEKIGITKYSDCSTKVEYNSDNDIEFLNGSGDYVVLKENEFMILFPEDAHKPSISINKNSPSKVRKAVVKVKI